MPTDLVIVTRFEIELEQSAGTLIICIPYSMIEPIRGKLAAGFQAEVEDIDYTWQKRLKEIIISSELELTVQLGTTEITGEKLIYLKKGDVIELDQDAEDPLNGLIGNLVKIKGYAGIQRGFQALKITDKIYTK
jgi:flagellar motor switch protein FliM